MNVAYLLIAHLIGDFLLQNHWMQTKGRNTLVCLVHILCYSIPFLGLLFAGLIPEWVFCAILIQHFLQDRFSLHLKWMRLCRQTTPDLWPVGPLCMDQAWHIAFIGIFALLAGI
jgi:Protein of unknown function (DUF3307)